MTAFLQLFRVQQAISRYVFHRLRQRVYFLRDHPSGYISNTRSKISKCHDLVQPYLSSSANSFEEKQTQGLFFLSDLFALVH